MGVMKVTAFVAVLALASIASAAHPHARSLRAAGLKSQSSQLPSELQLAAQFGLWAQAHQKNYSSPDAYASRMQTFQTNLETIKAHNAQGHGWTMAVNQFADLTPEEFRATRLGLQPTTGGHFRERLQGSPFRYENATAPASVDWVTAGAVTPVKNQESCGSCWAFSTTGSVEGANYLATGELVSLSEQELVDCDTSKDMGCGGGLMDFAFDFIKKNGGLDTEADYGYWGLGTFCNPLREGRHVVTIDGHEDVPENSEADLAKAVANQPVSVAICADSLQFYSSGVVSKCCTGLDHGVLVVGYDTAENDSPYWVVKNSWGSGWGENGYFKLAKDVPDKHGMCGVARVASYPVKTHPNPKNVPEVCGWLGWSECSTGSKCTCNLDLFGLLCVDWGCAGAA